MANTLTLAQKYTLLMDRKFKKISLTANLEVNKSMVKDFDGVGTIQIMDIVLSGLGDYDRATGHPAGDITTSWSPYTIDNDRGRSFTVDEMDDAESLNVLFLNSVNQFMEQKVVPEVDATRFSAMAGKGSTPVLAALADGDAYLAAIDAATLKMDDDEVPDENRVLYIGNTGYSLLKNANKITRDFKTETTGEKTIERRFNSLDGMEIIKVPVGRFNTTIVLGSDGFTQTGTAINFQIVHVPSVNAITRHKRVKVISAEANQITDGEMFKYRIYHDVIITTNAKPGVYTHAEPVV